MNKKDLIELLGGTAERAATKLGYSHRNSIQRFPDVLTDSQVNVVLLRMRAVRIPIPQNWRLK